VQQAAAAAAVSIIAPLSTLHYQVGTTLTQPGSTGHDIRDPGMFLLPGIQEECSEKAFLEHMLGSGAYLCRSGI